jgi:hypothetical protein
MAAKRPRPSSLYTTATMEHLEPNACVTLLCKLVFLTVVNMVEDI